MTWQGIHWYNISAPLWTISLPSRKPVKPLLHICLWNLFNRRCADGSHYWGVGLLQIGDRHLFAVMFSGVSILFIGRIP
jgi:hypothetical protein